MNRQTDAPTALTEELQLFPWREEFNTGIELIDQQHQRLVAMLNQLANHFVDGCDASALDDLLEQLSEYADYHFSSEEAIWQSRLAGQAEFAEHCHSHQQFFDSLKSLREQRSSVEQRLQDVFRFLTSWLTYHILDNDKRMALAIQAIDQGHDAQQAGARVDQQINGAQRRLINLILDMYSHLSGRTIELMRERRARQHAERSREALELALDGERQQLGEALFHEVFEQLPQAVLLCRARDGLILRANPAACELSGQSLSLLTGSSLGELLGEHLSLQQHHELLEQQAQLQHADGRCLNVGLLCSRVRLRSLGDCLMLLLRNREREDFEQQRLQQLAFTDPVTGLLNRVAVSRAISESMAQLQDSQRLAVVYFDLDNFREVNDSHGESAGNRLLRWVGKRWQNVLGVQRPLARLGGDEFIALIPDASDGERFARLLKRLFRSLESPFVVGNQSFRISASAGVSYYPQTGPADADTLIRQADQAMYQAKLGGNGYRFFDEQQERNLRSHHQTLSRLRLALQRRELVLYYQPKVNLRSGRITGAEALLRWEHPNDGLLPPASFLPLIEDDPLSVAVGDWVLEQALRQLEGWHSEGLELPISVNVAPLQLQDSRFVEKLAELLARHPRIRPDLLELEVLESSAIADMQQALGTLRDCRALGVQLALDDFGTGYSSLAYLKQLPVQTLKIDRSFVRDMLSDPDDLNILQGIISLAQAFGLKVIAEGVENPEQGSRLIELGCLHAQGYYIARPMPPAALIDWMRQWKPVAAWQGSADN